MASYGNVSLDQLEAHLKKELGAVFTVDTNAIWSKVAVALETGAKDCFNSGSDPDGVPWSPLKHSRIRGGNKPLLDRGLLRASLTSNGQYHIHRTTRNTLEWGTNLINAAVHNFGAVIRPKNGKWLVIPASLEAMRAGSPRRFPDAENRLKWIFNKTGGVIVERETRVRKDKKKRKGKNRKKKGDDAKPKKRGGKTKSIVHYYLTKEVTIPKRRFVGISQQTNGEISFIIQEEIFKSLRVRMI